MCGIVGIVGPRGDEKLLQKMTQSLIHRGPDEAGFFVEPIDRIFLGMRRLKVIDLIGGKQPIFNETNEIGVIFNGEIYNYLELKKDLQKHGHQFKTQTDTEVLVHLWEKYDLKMFSHLNGMFAFALWDKNRKLLILARDPVGEKPLYYTHLHQTLFFASELKVFQNLPWPLSLNSWAVTCYFDQTYIPSPHTVWQNIFTLPPGHYLSFHIPTQTVKVQAYHTLLPPMPANARDLEFTPALKQLDQLLSKAVKRRLIADVPLGIFLSGGLDSTLVAYYAQQHSSQPVKTFHLKITGSGFDESPFAQKAADLLQTHHHEMTITEQSLLEIIPQLAILMDEPLADPAFIPQYLLARLTRQQVTVALGGDGGDEIFWGYRTFSAWKPWQIIRRFPSPLIKLAQYFAYHLPHSQNYSALTTKLKAALINFSTHPYHQHFRWYSPWTKDELKQLLAPLAVFPSHWENYFRYDTAWPLPYHLSQLSQPSPHYFELLGLSSWLYQTYYLPDNIFKKVDRATMAVSLEARSPFVDPQVWQFANQLPPAYKYHWRYGGNFKFILLQLLKQKLPPFYRYRWKNQGVKSEQKLAPRKRGFSGSISQWLQGPLQSVCQEIFYSHHWSGGGIIDKKFSQYLWKNFQQGRYFRARQIWTLLCWYLWWNEYGSD